MQLRNTVASSAPPRPRHPEAPCSCARCCPQRPVNLVPTPCEAGPSVVGSIGGRRVVSLCPSLYPRLREVCGEPGPPRVATCLGRRLLLRKLHLLVEDGRETGGNSHQINYLLKINMCSLNAILAAAPLKCSTTRFVPLLVPGGGGRSWLCEWVCAPPLTRAPIKMRGD